MSADTRGPENVVRDLASRVIDLEDELAAEHAHADRLAEELARVQALLDSEEQERARTAALLVEHIERRRAQRD